jgi:hypothetical protein
MRKFPYGCVRKDLKRFAIVTVPFAARAVHINAKS